MLWHVNMIFCVMPNRQCRRKINAKLQLVHLDYEQADELKGVKG